MSTRTKANPFRTADNAAGQEAAKTFEQGFAAAQEQAQKAGAQVVKGYADFANFGRENVEALIRSGSIMTKGAEDIGKAFFAFAQSSTEIGLAAGKAMLTVKTLRELVDLQTEYTKNTLESLLAEGAKLSEMTVKVAHEAAEPINARVNAAIVTLSKPVVA